MDRREIGATQRRRPQTLAAVVALALIVAVGPFAVAGLRLDDLGRAVGRARETLVSTIETILGPRIILGEPTRPQPADARAPAAPASRPVAVPPPTSPAGAPADPGPPAEPPAAGLGSPGARGGRGPIPGAPLPAPDPGAQPPSPPQPDEGSLLETLLGLLDVLPSVVLDDAPEDSPQASGDPQTSGPGEEAFNALTEPVETLLGPSSDGGQAPADGLAPQVSAQTATPQPPADVPQRAGPEAVPEWPVPGLGSKPVPGGALLQPGG